MWRRLAPSRAAEDDLKRLLATMPVVERNAFWAAVLIIDGRVTVRALMERAVFVREPAPPPPSNVIPLSGRTCADCGDPLPVRPKGTPGPAARFCARCRGRRENDARKTRRARL